MNLIPYENYLSHPPLKLSEHVYAEPLAEVLAILDYAIDILEGGERPSHPRSILEHHYAQLYRDGDELFVAMKDAVEPNRRNINSIFKVCADINGFTAKVTAGEMVWWGVEATLSKEMKDFRSQARRVHIDALEVKKCETQVRFEAPGGLNRKLNAWISGLWGYIEHLMGRYSFLVMFAMAIIVGFIPSKLLFWSADLIPSVDRFIVKYSIWIFISLPFIQLGILLRLITRELPTWMDNAYRHENRADNLKSLRRSSIM